MRPIIRSVGRFLKVFESHEMLGVAKTPPQLNRSPNRVGFLFEGEGLSSLSAHSQRVAAWYVPPYRLVVVSPTRPQDGAEESGTPLLFIGYWYSY